MVQIISYEVKKGILTVGFKVDDFVVYSSITNEENRTKQQLLQQAYEQVKQAIDYEKTLSEHSITTNEEGEEFIPEPSRVDKVKLWTSFKYILCNEEMEVYQLNLTHLISNQYGEIINELPNFSTTYGSIDDNVLTLPKVTEDTEVIIQAELDGVIGEARVFMKPAIDIIPDMPTDVELLQQETAMLREENLGLMLATVEMYETMYAENNQLMLALAEMYETIMMGGM